MASKYPPTSKPQKGIIDSFKTGPEKMTAPRKRGIGKDVGFQPDPPTRKPSPRKITGGPMKVTKPYKLNPVKTTRAKRAK